MEFYASDHEITIEELRELVYDDRDTKTLGDERYQTWIERYPDDWRIVAYVAADRLYEMVAQKPNRISSDGDSISWPPERLAVLKDRRDMLKALIEADGYGEVITVTGTYLTPGCTTEAYEWQ